MESIHDRVVAIFNTHPEAGQAFKALQNSGFDTTRLSIVAKNPNAEGHVVGYYNTGDRIKHWGKTGAFWGSPDNNILQYELALKTDKYLVLAHGTGHEAAKAKQILKRSNPVEFHSHSPQEVATDQRQHNFAAV
jgi:hypothetical protein